MSILDTFVSFWDRANNTTQTSLYATVFSFQFQLSELSIFHWAEHKSTGLTSPTTPRLDFDFANLLDITLFDDSTGYFSDL